VGCEHPVRLAAGASIAISLLASVRQSLDVGSSCTPSASTLPEPVHRDGSRRCPLNATSPAGPLYLSTIVTQRDWPFFLRLYEDIFTRPISPSPSRIFSLHDVYVGQRAHPNSPLHGHVSCMRPEGARHGRSQQRLQIMAVHPLPGF
jgi:hypothetical protein